MASPVSGPGTLAHTKSPKKEKPTGKNDRVEKKKVKGYKSPKTAISRIWQPSREANNHTYQSPAWENMQETHTRQQRHTQTHSNCNHNNKLMKCRTVRTFSSPQFSLQRDGELVRQRKDLKVWSSQWIETICRYRVHICCIPSPWMDWSLCSTCAIQQLWHADLICIKSTRESDIQGKSEALLVFGANPTRTSILKTTKQRMSLCVTK